MNRSIVGAVVIGGLSIGVIQAQFSVIDVAAIAKLVDQINKMKEQYSLLTDTYLKINQQYEQMIWNAQMITNKGRWKRAIYSWRYPRYSNRYGKTGTWIDAIRNGDNAAGGWLAAAAEIPDYAAVWSTIPKPSQGKIKTHWASMELTDGAAVVALETIGDVRNTAQAAADATDQLERDSLSDAAAMNTEVGVLNKINAGNIIALRNQQEHSRMMLSVVEHGVIEAKLRRDAMAESFDNDRERREYSGALHDQHLKGATKVLQSFRL